MQGEGLPRLLVRLTPHLASNNELGAHLASSLGTPCALTGGRITPLPSTIKVNINYQIECFSHKTQFHLGVSKPITHRCSKYLTTSATVPTHTQATRPHTHTTLLPL